MDFSIVYLDCNGEDLYEILCNQVLSFYSNSPLFGLASRHVVSWYQYACINILIVMWEMLNLEVKLNAIIL